MFGFRSPSQKDVAACPFGQPVPQSGAAAMGAEVKADLEAAIRVTLVNLVIALDPNLGPSGSQNLMLARFRSAINPKSRYQKPITIVPIVGGNFYVMTLFSNVKNKDHWR